MTNLYNLPLAEYILGLLITEFHVQVITSGLYIHLTVPNVMASMQQQQQ